MFEVYFAGPGRRYNLLAAIVAIAFGALAADTGARAEEYLLGSGDRLRLTIDGRPDLSHEVTVQADGSLTVPTAGRVDAAGSSLTEVERRVSSLLRSRLGLDDADALIDVVAYRPIYVIGDVSSPGAYEYVPGMTVLEAIALAGGYRVPVPQDVSVRLEVARLRERIGLLRFGLAEALVRKARLLAEWTHESMPETVEEALQYGSREELARLVQNEVRLLTRRDEAVAGEIAILEQQKAQLRDEIAALEAQTAAKLEQTAILQKERDALDPLLKRGISPVTRGFALDRAIVEAEAAHRELEASTARARREISKVDQTVLNLETSMRTDIASGLKTVDDQLAVLTLELAGAKNQLVQADRLAADIARLAAGKNTPGTPQIVRRSQDGRQAIEAMMNTPVRPGDVIRIPLRPL